MSYLYGDSTLSKLEVNYIELLRDAVDCCVQVLLADQRIAEGAARTRALEGATAAEIAKLQRVGSLVPKAFEGTPVGEPASATARCVATIVRSAADIVGAATAEATATLESAVGRRDAEAAVERELVVKALETLLIKHDLPDMKSDVEVGLMGGTHYVCRLGVATPFGLVAVMELEVPPGHLFERVVRVDRLAERLEVQVPEIAGWLHKEVKLRAQHLEKHHLTRFSRRGAASELRLRLAPDGAGAGYDLVFAGAGEPVRLIRVDEQQKREEPFDAQEADVAKLYALRDKVAAAVAEIAQHRTKILDARLEGETLANHAKPSVLVERIIAQLAPEAREIAARSQSAGELVLRRAIGGDRREEIFLSKQDLKAKIEPLNEHNRALFEALFDGGPVSHAEPPPAPPPRSEPPAIPAADGPAPISLRKTLTPTVIPTGATPATGVPVRPPTPLYGVPPVTPPAAPTPPTPPYGIQPVTPAAPPPAATMSAPATAAVPTVGAKPSPAAEPAVTAAAGRDAPPRKTAPLAAALDRPPPGRPSVSGEIGSVPDQKRTEPSGPHTTRP